MMQIDRVFQAQAGTRRPRTGRYFSSTALATLIAFGAAGAVSSQQSQWTGAENNNYGTGETGPNNPGNWDTATVPGDGNTDDALVSGVGSLSNVDGADTFIPGNVTVEGGATLSVDGQLGTAANQTVITVNDGTLSVTGTGTIDGNVGISGMTSNTTVDGTVTGNVDITRGNLNVGGTIQGDLIYDGAVGQNAVDVTGAVEGVTKFLGASTVTVSGDLEDGLIIGTGSDVTIQAGGSVTGSPTTVGIDTTTTPATPVGGGTLTVDAGGLIDGGGLTLNGSSSDGVVTNNGTIVGPVAANNGTLTTTGTIDGTLTQSAGGTVNAAGTITGDVTVNSGDFNATGPLTMGDGVGDDLTNSARINVQGGPVTVNGDVTNNSGGSIRVASGESFNFGTMNNSGRLQIGGAMGTSTATFGGNVVGSAGSTFDMQDGAADDSMIVQGNVSGTNTVAVDLDLTTTNAGFADVLDVNGQLDGNVTVNVDSIRGPLGYTLQNTPITVVDANSIDVPLDTINLTGDLPQGPSGLVLYRLQELQPGDTAVQIESLINPAIGGVAAAFSSVQSVLGTVVNRPSGAYVSGIAFDAPDNCSTGIWGRVIGGRVNTDSETTNTTTAGTVDSSGRLDYAGLQGGADFGCFEAFDGGWDISGGMLFGANTGEFLQRASGLRTVGTFDQYFLGGYVAAARGNWSGEMQLRYGMTDYNLENTDLGVFDEDTSVDSYSLSGSVTYRQQIAPGLALLPSIGFNVTESDEASVALRARGTRNRIGTLTVEDHTNLTGFLGATLSRTSVNEAAGSATNAFLTGTYYIDGSDERDTTVTLGTPGGATASNRLETSETGDFAELSAGGSIVRLVGNGPGGVRQVNYSVRVDARYGEDLDGVGVTGQVRYQF